ncbi:Protein of unknown function [Gryllus bimaculatus]|nr:Protein of unknown function [Gryllus bimaculatus]
MLLGGPQIGHALLEQAHRAQIRWVKRSSSEQTITHTSVTSSAHVHETHRATNGWRHQQFGDSEPRRSPPAAAVVAALPCVVHSHRKPAAPQPHEAPLASRPLPGYQRPAQQVRPRTRHTAHAHAHHTHANACK